MKNLIICTISILFASMLQAQTFIPNTKISFDIPVNWVAETSGDQIILSSINPGMILINGMNINSNTSLKELLNEKIETDVISLIPKNTILYTSQKGSVDYSGQMFGLAIEGYGMMKLSESKTISGIALAICQEGVLDQNLKNTINDIIQSFKFPIINQEQKAVIVNHRTNSSTNTASDITKCHQYFSGMKLVYYNGRNSSTTEKFIHLCPNGEFYRTGHSQTVYGQGGYSEQNFGGNGYWEIEKSPNNYKIMLQWSNGNIGHFNVVENAEDNDYIFDDEPDWYMYPNSSECR